MATLVHMGGLAPPLQVTEDPGYTILLQAPAQSPNNILWLCTDTETFRVPAWAGCPSAVPR